MIAIVSAKAPIARQTIELKCGIIGGDFRGEKHNSSSVTVNPEVGNFLRNFRIGHDPPDLMERRVGSPSRVPLP